MGSPKRFLTASIFSAILMLCLIPAVAHAQDATPDPASCNTYSSDAATAFQNQNQTLGAGAIQVSSLASVSISLAKVRLEYQDMPVPAGCEVIQSQALQIAHFDEDVIFLNLAILVDSANKANYGSFLSTTWQPRFDAYKASLSATPEAATVSTPEVPSGAEAAICTDADYRAQLASDLKAMKPSVTDAASIGATGLSVIALRYRLEDLTPPAGCEAARQDFTQFLSLFEEEITLRLAAISDTANISTYSDFLADTIYPRERAIYAQVGSDFGMTVTPEATATAEATDAS